MDHGDPVPADEGEFLDHRDSVPASDDEQLQVWATELMDRRSPTTSVWMRLVDSGGLLWHSGDLSAVLGCDAAPYLADRQRFLELVHPEDLHKFTTGPARPGDPARTWRLVRPDGQVRWVSSEVLSQEDTPQGPAYVGTVTDVTGQVHELVRGERLNRVGARAADVLGRAGEQDVDQAVHSSLAAVVPLLDGGYAMAFRLHPSGRMSSQLEWYASGAGPDKPPPVQPAPAMVSWLRDAVAGGASVVDASTITPEAPKAHEIVTTNGFRSVAQVHVRLAGDVVGMVVVGSWRPPGDWPAGDVEMLQRLAQSVHAALDRADAQRLGREAFGALLAARDEAARASADKTDFLSRASHDLRSPAAAVVAAAELLGLEVPAAETSAYLRHIRANAQQVLDVLDDIVSLGRSGTQSPRAPGTVDVGVLAHSALDQVRPLAELAGITLDLHVEGSARIVADPVLVTQVLSNLVSNAVKYNRPGGRVDVWVSSSDQGLQVVVGDTGPGIPELQLDLVWQPFERLGAEHSGVPGTGLGLAIVSHAARELGGTVSVQSGPDGSTFTFVLPGTAEPGPKACGAVLVVDDNETWREVLSTSLCQVAGFCDVRTATSGAEAVVAVRQRVPELVVLDRHLPDADGEEVVRWLRALPGAEDLPVLMVSADMTEESRRRCLRAGVGAYLVKPPSNDDLRDAVLRLVGESPSGDK